MLYTIIDLNWEKNNRLFVIVQDNNNSSYLIKMHRNYSRK